MEIPDTIAPLFDRYGSPSYPVVYYQGQLISLTVESQDRRHQFGGALPDCEGIGAPETHRLVLKLDLTDLGFSMPKQDIPNVLPLIFNFNLNGLSTDYVVENTRLRFDHPTCFFGRDPDPDFELPYAEYPEQFPEIELGKGIEYQIEYDLFESLFTSQGLTGMFDEPDISGHLFIIVPPYRGLETSMWNVDGRAEGLLCVFDVNPHTGRIDASNQST